MLLADCNSNFNPPVQLVQAEQGDFDSLRLRSRHFGRLRMEAVWRPPGEPMLLWPQLSLQHL
jgi:hypothetical protein